MGKVEDLRAVNGAVVVEGVGGSVGVCECGRGQVSGEGEPVGKVGGGLDDVGKSGSAGEVELEWGAGGKARDELGGGGAGADACQFGQERIEATATMDVS